MSVIPKEKVDEVLARYKKQSRASLARELHLAYCTVSKIVYKHEHGIPQDYSKWEDVDRRRAYVCSHWCEQPVSEIAKALGCHTSSVYKIAKKIGLIFPKEWVENRAKISEKNLAKAHAKEVRARGGKARSETFRKERLRVLYGLAQKTRLKLPSLPLRAYQAKWHLLNKHNYFEVEGDAYAIGYDSETRRTPTKRKYNEEYYVKMYGFKFIEGE